MFKKISLMLISSFAVLLMANSFAAIPADPCEETPEVCCKEPAPGPFAFAYAKELSLSCPKDFYFDAQYLLMQAKEEGLEVAIVQKHGEHGGAAGTNTYVLTGGDVQGFSTGSSKWHWTNGLRLAFGGYFNHDIWGLEAQYTYLRIKNDHGLNATGSVQLPFWQNNLTGTQVFDNVSMRWTGNVNVFDLMLSKPYYVSRYFSLNPSVGLRSGWIEEDFLIRHSNRSTLGKYNTTAKNDFWGVGLRAKLASEWALNSNFSLFGHVAASMLYSHFDVTQSAATFASVGDYEIKHDFYTNTPNAEMVLGLSYGQYFFQKKHHFAIRIAYEFHEWFSHNRLRRFTDGAAPGFNDTTRGSLMYSGLSFQLAFNF